MEVENQDLRNKLGPIKNLFSQLELYFSIDERNHFLGSFQKTILKDKILKELSQAKINLDYILNIETVIKNKS